MSHESAKTLDLALLKTLTPPEPDAFGDALLLWAQGPRAGASVLATRAALRAGCREVCLITTPELAPHLMLALPEATIFAETPKSAPQLSAAVWHAGQDGAALLGELPLAIVGGKLSDLGDLPADFGLGKKRKSAAHVLIFEGDESDKAIEAAREYHAPLILIGKSVGVAAPDGTLYKAEDDKESTHPGAATSEVLAGIVGGLLARGAEPLTAALWGAFLGAVALDAAVEDLGEDSVSARDLVERLPFALRYARRSAAPKKDAKFAGFRSRI